MVYYSFAKLLSNHLSAQLDMNKWLALVSLFTILLANPKTSSASPFIRSVTDRRQTASLDLLCEAWRFTVETNDAGEWELVPHRCIDFVRDYVTGERYSVDSDAVANISVAYATSVAAEKNLNGKIAWVFDIDETLLTNLPYYEDHGYGSEAFDETSWNEWVVLAKAPVLPASLRLYNELQKLGFTIFLLTGRDENQRNFTESNLLSAGYSNWERLILRGSSDQGKTATIYKSEKRKEIEDEGYVIYGSSGDQWSDLTGFAIAKRSFKLPNPLYFIP